VSCCVRAGWLNLLGQIAAVSAVAFLCKDLIATMAMMSSTLDGSAHLEFTPSQVRLPDVSLHHHAEMGLGRGGGGS
jgi:hypothetical protein